MPSSDHEPLCVRPPHARPRLPTGPLCTQAKDIVDPDEAREASLRFVTGERAEGLVCDSDDEGIEDHPFFDSLRAPPKDEAWDAESILSTYTITENHPTAIRMARKPRKGHEPIRLDERTGLPMGTMLPATEERMRREAEAIGGGGGNQDEDEDEDEIRFGTYEGVNLGAARPKKEAADEKKERKAAAKAMKAARRQEKKGTKEAFRAEKNEQTQIRMKTTQLPMQSLSRFPGH